MDNLICTDKMDRRTRKTKKAVKNALMVLLSKNDITKISIKDIADLADINRKTFYAYYQDVFAVVDEIEKEVIERLTHIIDENDIAEIVSDPYQMYGHIMRLLDEDRVFYELLVNSSSFGTILDKITKVIKEKISIALMSKTTVDSLMLNFIVDFLAGGFVLVFKEWFNSTRQISLEDLSKQLSIILSNGITVILK